MLNLAHHHHYVFSFHLSDDEWGQGHVQGGVSEGGHCVENNSRWGYMEAEAPEEVVAHASHLVSSSQWLGQVLDLWSSLLDAAGGGGGPCFSLELLGVLPLQNLSHLLC